MGVWVHGSMGAWVHGPWGASGLRAQPMDPWTYGPMNLSSALQSRPVSLSPDLDALVRGQHGDPFRLLGPHVEGTAVVVRALRPHVAGLTLVLTHPQAERVEMARLHRDGLYEARLQSLSS